MYKITGTADTDINTGGSIADRSGKMMPERKGKGVIRHGYMRGVGGGMDKKKEEQLNRQKNHNEFNSITRKVEPENQNQRHNARKEGIQPINQKR